MRILKRYCCSSSVYLRQFFVVSTAVCILLACASISLRAQVTTADVVGRVTDASGAVIIGAHITIENREIQNTRSIITGATGDFAINLLPPGSYTLRIEATGFKTATVPILILTAGDRARADVEMQVGQIQEVVEVVAQAPMLQSDSSTVGTVVTENAVQDLPLNGRNYIELVQLVPGSNQGPPGALSSGRRLDDRRQTSAFSVNGQSDVLNNSLIDGMDNNERIVGTIGVKPSIDAIAEFRVQTNLYSAELGRTAGGVVNIVTKSGTNRFHGSLYEFLRNDKLNAKNFFATTGPKPKYRQNQFGGSIGGPIKKNRTFFFGDYEGLRIVQGITNVLTVPTPAEVRGDFSGNPTPIIDPLTWQQFPGNIIPSDRIDPVGAQYASLFPEPTSEGFISNYTGTEDRTQFSHVLDVRIDHRFSDEDAFFTRYSFNDVATFTPGALPPVNGIHSTGIIATSFGPSKQVAQNIHLNYIHIFSPKLLMELKFSYSRMNYASFPANQGTYASEKFGMPGVNHNPDNSGLAPVWVANYAALGDSWFVPSRYVENNFQYAGSIAYTRGAHNLKIGASLIRRQALNAQQSYGMGLFYFTGAATRNPVADLLLGISTWTSRITELVDPGYRTWEPGLYIQDNWRVKPWLTLNLGMRYDVFTPYTEAHNRISNLDIVNAKILVAGENGVSETADIQTDYSNLAPRIGFAATIGPGMVVRGGYGFTFFPTNYTSFFSLKNPPFVSTYGPVLFNRLSDGLPLPETVDAENPAGQIRAQALDYRSGYLQQFNLMVEKEFSGNVLRVGYVGQVGGRLAQTLPNINIAPPPGEGNPALPKPFEESLPDVTTISYMKSEGVSTYHALQISFERRLKAGFTLSSNYTWAHNIDDVDTLSGGKMGYGVVPDKVSEVDRGNSDLDVRHRFVLMANYEIPFGKPLSGYRRLLLDGWQINGIVVYQTGLPFTIFNDQPQSNTGVDSAMKDRPNRIKSGALPNPTLDEYFDTSAFVAQPFGTLGNAGRNILFGPSFKKVDLSLFRDFELSESLGLQFRAECYNLTNTPSFGSPKLILGKAGFGSITSMNPNYTQRVFQFGLKLIF